MTIVICGSRDYADRKTLERVMDDVLRDWREYHGDDPDIAHGDCPYGGADALGEEWALSRGLAVRPYPPQGRGRAAMLARDRAMVDEGAELVCGFSSQPRATAGTGYTCRYAYNCGVPVLFTGSDGQTRHFWNEQWTTAPS